MFYYIIFWAIKFIILHREHTFEVQNLSWALRGLEIQKKSLKNASQWNMETYQAPIVKQLRNNITAFLFHSKKSVSIKVDKK